MFTQDQLKRLIVAQNTLNEHYIPNWKNKVPKEKFLAALQCEWAEFLESAPRFYDHKWWKPTMQDDIQNVKVEIVDLLHFGLSLMILQQKGIHFDEENNINVEKFDKFYSLLRSEYLILREESVEIYNNLISVQELFTKISIFSISEEKVDLFGLVFTLFLRSLCFYVNWNFLDLYEAYWKKNELNILRIQNGYMEGKYQKVDENGEEDNRRLAI